jgi:hypothetical protein
VWSSIPYFPVSFILLTAADCPVPRYILYCTVLMMILFVLRRGPGTVLACGVLLRRRTWRLHSDRWRSMANQGPESPFPVCLWVSVSDSGPSHRYTLFGKISPPDESYILCISLARLLRVISFMKLGVDFTFDFNNNFGSLVCTCRNTHQSYHWHQGKKSAASSRSKSYYWS